MTCLLLLKRKPMDRTNKTLLEQMHINEFEIDQRKNLFYLGKEDITALQSAKKVIEQNIDDIVDRFYEQQTSIPEIALIIGDADTLKRLKQAQHQYLIDLFSGLYDMDYVNNRLRIGLVHKRIGVDPKLYLSGIYTLKSILIDVLSEKIEDAPNRRIVLNALEKLLLFDVTISPFGLALSSVNVPFSPAQSYFDIGWQIVQVSGLTVSLWSSWQVMHS